MLLASCSCCFFVVQFTNVHIYAITGRGHDNKREYRVCHWFVILFYPYLLLYVPLPIMAVKQWALLCIYQSLLLKISLAQLTTKIKLMKWLCKFTLQKNNMVCDVHTKTAVVNALLFTVSPFEATSNQSKVQSSGSWRIVVNMSANASGRPCK